MSSSKPCQSKSPIDQNKLLECPICLDTLTPPVIQCETGHPMCKSCYHENVVQSCPICRGPMTQRRHVVFEQLLESLRISLEGSCCYNHKGCNYKITGDKGSHEIECRYRAFKCEGNSFANWKCYWRGEYDQLEKHFKDCHIEKTSMQFRTEAAIKVNFHSDFKDVHLISFFNGQSYFYFKHRVDVKQQKLYWLIQYIGLKNNANNFYYEFELHNGPIRKLKVTEICYNDVTNADDLCEMDKCAVISFSTARSFLNEAGELPFRFRINKIKRNIAKD